MEQIASQVLFAAVAVASLGTAESPSIELRLGPSITPYTISLMASSVSGVADVKLQIATSEDNVNFSHYDDRANVIASTLLERPNGPELANEYPLSDVFNKFVKFKVSGVAANPADTLVSATILIHIIC